MSLHSTPSTSEGLLTKTPLRVKVLHASPPREYENAAKQKRVVLECVVADSTTSKRLLVYNRTAFPLMKEGKSLLLLNVYNKTKDIVVTTASKILLIPEVNVPDDIVQNAKALINQTTLTAEDKTVLEVLDLPTGSTFNLKVKIIEADDVTTVTTSWKSEADVRNGVCADETASIFFAFWRQLASYPLQENDCIYIQNAVLSKTSDGSPKITSQSGTKIEMLPPDSITKVKGVSTSRHEEEGEVIAISKVNVYRCCERRQCYSVKLTEKNKCPKCETEYSTTTEQNLAVVCDVAVQQDEDIRTLTIFKSQVDELMKDKPFKLTTDNEQVEKEIIQALPQKIGFTCSPKKDNTVTFLKKMSPDL